MGVSGSIHHEDACSRRRPMPSLTRPMVLTLLAGPFVGAAIAAYTAQTRTFDDDTPGQVARGFTNEVGEWKVVTSDKGNAFAQVAKNPEDVFNITLAEKPELADVILTVRMKAITGELDQGGGLVWRARDKKNYYIAR